MAHWPLIGRREKRKRERERFFVCLKEEATGQEFHQPTNHPTDRPRTGERSPRQKYERTAKNNKKFFFFSPLFLHYESTYDIPSTRKTTTKKHETTETNRKERRDIKKEKREKGESLSRRRGYFSFLKRNFFVQSNRRNRFLPTTTKMQSVDIFF